MINLTSGSVIWEIVVRIFLFWYGIKMTQSTDTSNYIDDRYEGCGEEGPIRCIFLCEFHHVAGPKITCQVCRLI